MRHTSGKKSEAQKVLMKCALSVRDHILTTKGLDQKQATVDPRHSHSTLPSLTARCRHQWSHPVRKGGGTLVARRGREGDSVAH